MKWLILVIDSLGDLAFQNLDFEDLGLEVLNATEVSRCGASRPCSRKGMSRNPYFEWLYLALY